MIYFDTNVLVYFSIVQDLKKQQIAAKLIKGAIKDEKFFISPLVLIEYIFVLAKLKILNEQKEKIEFFKIFCNYSITVEDVLRAYAICGCNDCRNINDALHLTIANKFCREFVTFDSDFKKFEKFSKVKINLIKEAK
jgi:predicted nucleic acid-binding protein